LKPAIQHIPSNALNLIAVTCTAKPSDNPKTFPSMLPSYKQLPLPVAQRFTDSALQQLVIPTRLKLKKRR
jgi:hypothetical protein